MLCLVLVNGCAQLKESDHLWYVHFSLKRRKIFTGPIQPSYPNLFPPYLRESRYFWPSAGRAGPQMQGVDNSFPVLGPYCLHQTWWRRSEAVLRKRSKWVFVFAEQNDSISIPTLHLSCDLWWAQVAMSEGKHGRWVCLLRILTSPSRGVTIRVLLWLPHVHDRSFISSCGAHSVWLLLGEESIYTSGFQCWQNARVTVGSF